jgi:protein archease
MLLPHCFRPQHTPTSGLHNVGSYTYPWRRAESIHWGIVTIERWEHFAHGADIGVRGFGSSLAAAFEQTALAMTAAVTNPNSVEPREPVELACNAPDYELLLVDWLNAIIYEMATRGMLFSRFEVAISGGCLRGQAWGETVNIEKHQPIVEIKGATYTSLHVGAASDGTWIAQCVVDV